MSMTPTSLHATTQAMSRGWERATGRPTTPTARAAFVEVARAARCAGTCPTGVVLLRGDQAARLRATLLPSG